MERDLKAMDRFTQTDGRTRLLPRRAARAASSPRQNPRRPPRAKRSEKPRGNFPTCKPLKSLIMELELTDRLVRAALRGGRAISFAPPGSCTDAARGRTDRNNHLGFVYWNSLQFAEALNAEPLPVQFP